MILSKRLFWEVQYVLAPRYYSLVMFWCKCLYICTNSFCVTTSNLKRILFTQTIEKLLKEWASYRGICYGVLCLCSKENTSLYRIAKVPQSFCSCGFTRILNLLFCPLCRLLEMGNPAISSIFQDHCQMLL